MKKKVDIVISSVWIFNEPKEISEWYHLVPETKYIDESGSMGSHL